MTEFERKIQRFSKSRQRSHTWRTLRFGYRQAVYTFDDYDSFSETWNATHRLKGVSVGKSCHFQGEFDGTIFIMDSQDAAELNRKLREEQEKCENWWKRYHAADETTKAQMRCGAIT